MRALAAAAALVALPVAARAQLADGVVAPEFRLQAALGGSVQAFDLRAALARGPVVLYFFPKSFTSGCTVEAHAFSERIADFRRAGAAVVGVSGDDIATQRRFSTQECRSSFSVASDPGLRVAARYDATVFNRFANRTSYVIARDGRIVEAYTDFAPEPHVRRALAAVRRLHAGAR